MKKFTFAVTETRVHKVVYTVEAETEAEAWLKADRGDTTDEFEKAGGEVIGRVVETWCIEAR